MRAKRWPQSGHRPDPARRANRHDPSLLIETRPGARRTPVHQLPDGRDCSDTGTYLARYDDLYTGKDEKIDVSQVDVSMNGIELQDREFFAAIRQAREPNSRVAQVLNCYRTLHQLEQQMRG